VSNYIHGVNSEEQKRLSLMNTLMNQRCVAKMTIPAGAKILDVGSGLGQMSQLLVQTSGKAASCLGVERDQLQIDQAQTKGYHNIEFRKGDGRDLPLLSSEVGSFDFAHTRFLLEHVPNPSAVVKEMFRALKPGGSIALADDDHQAMMLYPEPEGFQKLWSAYMDAYIEIGNDPYIGRKMSRLLYEQGFVDLKVDVAFFGDCAGTETFRDFCLNLYGVIDSARNSMITSGLISELEFAEYMENLLKWSELPHASMWYYIFLAFGKKPNSK